MPLTLATWNINSVRLREALVCDLLRTHRPDILCLQETKSPVDKIPRDDFAALGYPHMVARGQKGYNGVAILSRRPIEDAGPLARLAEPGVDRPRIVVRPVVRLRAAADPLGGRAQTVEVHVAADRIDGASGLDTFWGDQLRASPMLGFGPQHESGIVDVVPVAIVIVVVDPHGQALTEPLDEGKRRLFVACPPCVGGKGDIQDHHTPRKAVWLGQLTGRPVGQVRETTHLPSMRPARCRRNSQIPGSVFPKPISIGNTSEIQRSHRSHRAAAEGAPRP